jgi:transglutaminase-like putative cysteine protease
VKIVHLDTNRIPAPLGLARLHIDKVDQPDFFAWAEGEVVQMTRERIPPFTVIRLVSQVPAAGQLQEWAFPREGRVLAEADVTFAVPNNEQAAAIAALAKAWAGNASRGWPQIAAVVSRLREQYEHAPEATVPAGCHDSVAHFLLDSHRGPDYLFASAAAILLRHLGYRTRLVSGFYAAPEKYDSRSRHTPVVAQDVHFWAEVELGFNHWVTVEATPGYEVLQPPTTLAQRCLQAMRSAWQWCWNHPASLAAGCVVLVATAWYRRHLLDFLLRSLWHIPASRSAEACILATVWLLDRRCSCVGRPRPKFVTLTSWYGNSDVTKEGDTEAVKRLFLRMVDWYLYAPSPIRRSTPAWSQQEVRATCLWAIRFWSLRRCYRRFSQSGPRMQGRST